MTTETKTTAMKTTALDHPAPSGSTTMGDLTRRARDAADVVGDVATDLTARMPAAAAEVDRIVRSGSDDTLRLVTAAVIGASIGLLAGGAGRIVVLASLAPAVLMGAVLSGRRSL